MPPHLFAVSDEAYRNILQGTFLHFLKQLLQRY